MVNSSAGRLRPEVASAIRGLKMSSKTQSTQGTPHARIVDVASGEMRMSERDVIVQQALALPVEDRAFVADAIERSLVDKDFATPEIASAWMVEIERRALAYERGETTAEDWRTVVSRIRTRLSADARQ
jgi:hypothetical protein